MNKWLEKSGYSNIKRNDARYKEVAMYREILNQLAEWQEKEDRKVLLLAGGKGV